MKRYRPVFDKFLAYALAQDVTTWNRVNTELVRGYAAWLDGEGYAYRTEYLELTTLKQAVNWMTEAGHLVATARVETTLLKPTGTDTHCWTPDEVRAIVQHCSATPGLEWLGEVAIALASTGLRISELAGLRWSDVDLANNLIRLTDESRRAPRRSGGVRRETKTGRSRSFPISRELRPVLERMPQPADGVVSHGPRGGALKPDTVRTILVREVLTPLSSHFPSPDGKPGFRDGRLLSFRHYFCSTCANGGASEAAVMHWLGHRDSQMVRHYYHLHNAEAPRQMSQVTFISPTTDTVSAAG